MLRIWKIFLQDCNSLWQGVDTAGGVSKNFLWETRLNIEIFSWTSSAEKSLYWIRNTPFSTPSCEWAGVNPQQKNWMQDISFNRLVSRWLRKMCIPFRVFCRQIYSTKICLFSNSFGNYTSWSSAIVHAALCLAEVSVCCLPQCEMLLSARLAYLCIR